nr:zinc finger protein 728-like isoform X1 [Danaus plexippus plexippus]
MKEFDINIEGYNVNGICVGCLNSNRRMCYVRTFSQCYKMLADIDVPIGISIKVCYECAALIRKVLTFREQILRSFDILSAYSKKHTILNSPKDLTCNSIQRLSRHTLNTNHMSEDVAIDIVKTEDIFGGFPQLEEQELKSEIGDIFVQEDNFDGVTSDDDVTLSSLKKKKVKEKHTILNSPKDLTCNSVQRLSRHTLNTNHMSDDVAIDIVKTEDIFGGFQEEGLKTGMGDIFVREDAFDRVPSDDDVMLSSKKTKKKKKKDKKQEKTPRKLKNLPSFVELYTMSETEMWSVRERDIASEEFSRLRYKCDTCVIAFNTKKLMEMHQRGKHVAKSESAQQCDVCTAYYLTAENLSAHRKLHLNAYRCTECGLVSCVKRVMSAHDCAKRAERYSCADCDLMFSSRSRLSYHRAASHGERPQCDCCGKIFANKMTLKYHLKVLPQNKNGTSKEPVTIPCKGCDKVFHSKKSYRAHVVIHDNQSYPCPTCGKLFQWKRNLARHARNHRERAAGTTHACHACGKTFASRDCYNNHMRLSKKHVHESQYTHACTYCGKKFPTKWCLVDHVDWEHLKRIKYQCSICFKAFKTAKIMYAHMSNLHAGKRVTLGEHLCHVCGKSYKTVKRLKSHVWAMHTNRSQEKSFKCPSCPAAFSWHTSVYKHLKLMHPKRAKPARVASVRELFPEQTVTQ